MAAPTAAQQKKEQEKQALFVELQKFCQNQDDDKASKVASKILHIYPNEEVAFQTKVISNVNRGMFSEAVGLINETPKLSGGLQYEKAYCFYRLQRMQEAKEVLEGCKENSIRSQELLYQIHYRLDMFEGAYDMLSELIKNSDDDLDAERQTNLSAIEASLKLTKSEKRIKHVEGDSYEMMYNHAVGLIGEDKISEAEVLLQQAEALAKETLQDEGASEEDMADELALIRAQRGYCIQRLGRVKEALALYSKVLKDKPSDMGLIACISNNVLCGNKDCSIFDSKKRLRLMTSEEVLPKLNNLQKRDMLLNECLFDLHIHHADETKRLCALVETRYPELSEEVLLIRCSLKTWTDNIVVARNEFIEPLEKGSALWLKVSLAMIQIALENEYINPAIDFMQKLGEHFYRPGLVSAVVTIYHHRNEIEKAGNVLRDAVEYYRKSGKNKENMKLLWRQTASFMMAQGDHQGAVKSLEELRKVAPDDSLILAQLIVAYSRIDVEKAKTLSKLLPPVPLEDIDVNVLESPNWLSHVKLLRKGLKSDVPATPAKFTSSDGKDKEKKKKKKKPKLPANYEIDRQPDPERWLPKYERSGYRPKKTRKGRVDVGKGTQGADSVTSAIYDMSSKVGQKGSGPEESPSPATWKKEHGKKKKRKK